MYLPKALLNIPVVDLNLSSSVLDALMDYMTEIVAGPIRVGDVIGKVDDLLRVRGFGKRGRKEFRARLVELITSWG